MDPEAYLEFQDHKRYLTSPLVMVAPRPLKPLVPYLATTPHSTSTALVAVREERLAKGSRSSPSRSVETLRPQVSAPEASAAPTDDRVP